jgi:hypothetical protein
VSVKFTVFWEEHAVSIFRMEETSTPKMKAADSSETLIPLYQTTQHDIREDSNLDVLLILIKDTEIILQKLIFDWLAKTSLAFVEHQCIL